MKPLFLPPRVQMRMQEVYGECPREAPDEIAEKVNDLWLQRNAAPESDLYRIDRLMEGVAAQAVTRKRSLILPSTELSAISYFIAGCYPIRELDPMERREEGDSMLIVSFARGFEPLQVAVFGDGLCLSDASEAAVEYLQELNPESLTEEERDAEGESIDVRRVPNPFSAKQDVSTGEPVGMSATSIQTWFERDRQHVELRDKATEQKTYVEWWDDDVSEAVEDGFLDPKNYHGSAYEYAKTHGMLPDGVSHNRALVEEFLRAGADFEKIPWGKAFEQLTEGWKLGEAIRYMDPQALADEFLAQGERV